MVEFIGYLGGVLLAMCGAPQAYKSYKDKHSNGLSWGLLLMWFFGEILLLIYTNMIHGFDLPLTINYGCNILFLVVIIYYKGRPNVR